MVQPEEHARQTIDHLLTAAGRHVCAQGGVANANNAWVQHLVHHAAGKRHFRRTNTCRLGVA